MGIYQNQSATCVGSLGHAGALAFEWSNTFPDWFQTTPPERIGLNGEYDYYGLQKRVEALYKRHFSPRELDRIMISQRGRVVILQGWVRDHAMLKQLIDLAKQVDGTYRVEAYWVNCDTDTSAYWSV